MRKYWTFDVETAAHVVYNTEEAKRTRVDLFYDDDSPHPDREVVRHTVWPLMAVEEGVDRDHSLIGCVTHDERIGERLESLRRRLTEAVECPSFHVKMSSLSERLREMFVGGQDYVLIISHPHGQAKKITLGKLRDGRIFGEDNYLEYHTATCPGSSGAKVFPLYRRGRRARLRQWGLGHMGLRHQLLHRLGLRQFGLRHWVWDFRHTGTRASSVSTDQVNYGNSWL